MTSPITDEEFRAMLDDPILGAGVVREDDFIPVSQDTERAQAALLAAVKTFDVQPGHADALTTAVDDLIDAKIADFLEFAVKRFAKLRGVVLDD